MRLAGKVAVITGGGSGIGKASSLLFSQEGAKVVIAQRTVSTGEEMVATLKSKGRESLFVRTDVTKASDAENLIRATINKFGKIDILFNNAGLTQRRVSFEETDDLEWDQLFLGNVKSIFLVSKYAVPEMKRAGGGAIINTASIAAVRPRPLNAVYCASKGAAVVLTKSMALDLAPYKIRVNCVNPVATDTPSLRSAAAGIGWEALKKQVEDSIPLGHRMADPMDTAYAALYLASDEASMITGVSLDVDGGRGI